MIILMDGASAFVLRPPRKDLIHVGSHSSSSGCEHYYVSSTSEETITGCDFGGLLRYESILCTMVVLLIACP